MFKKIPIWDGFNNSDIWINPSQIISAQEENHSGKNFVIIITARERFTFKGTIAQLGTLVL